MNTDQIAVLNAVGTAIAGLAAVVGVAVAIYVAVVQQRLQRRQMKQDLFGKRFEIYNEVNELINRLGAGEFDMASAARLGRLLRMGKFVFRSRAASYLIELGSAAEDYIPVLMGAAPDHGEREHLRTLWAEGEEMLAPDLRLPGE
jgi:hypothetical protein